MTLEENSLLECLLDDCDFSSVSMQELYKHSLKIEQFKDFQSFENIIKRVLRKSLPRSVSVDSKYLKMVCLDTASKNGLTTFVKILLSQDVKLNRVNKMYIRAPIHFATEGGHADTLEALLSDPTVNPNLQAGQQTALHFAIARNDEKCVFLLLKKGASANIPNNEGITAIYLATEKKQRNIVKLILQEHWQCIDLDYKYHNNLTIREMVHQNLPGLSLPTKYDTYRYFPCHMPDLQYYLRVKDEINFLKNMLIDEEVFSSMVEELLKIATQNDLREAVTKILHWLKRIEKKTRKFIVEQAARIAIEKGHYVILRELLNVVPQIATDLILDACLQLKKLKNQAIDTRFHISDWLECMKLMLDQKGVDIRKLIDDKSNTPLHYAAKSGYSDAVILFLNRDSYIGHMNELNIPPIADIPENILLNYFNNCIQMKMDEETDEYAIEFNYRCLIPHVSEMHDLGTRELEVFTYIAQNNNLKHLLKHPLLSSFLYLKWQKIRYLLLANFIFYMVFYLLLNAHIWSTAYANKTATQLDDVTNDNLGNMYLVQNIYQNNTLRRAIILLLMIFIFREILQFFCCPWHYMKDFKSYLQILIIAMTIALLCGVQHSTVIMVTLLSTWDLMILISQYPRFSTGIMIFRTVFFNFVRFILPYVLLIVVFASVFHLVFKNDKNFSNFGFSIFKTIIMLTGEFDISFESSKSNWSSRIVFLMFVFLMVIVLMNMLNGLAVSETAEILSKTELIKLIYQINLIAYFENVACVIGKPMNRHYFPRNSMWWKSFGSFVTSSIFLFSHLRSGRMSFKIYDSLNFHDDNGVILSKFEENDGHCDWKMDHRIIKEAKQIIINKNQLSDNDKIMIKLDRLQEVIETISDTKVLD